jgi:hypothetical protein
MGPEAGLQASVLKSWLSRKIKMKRHGQESTQLAASQIVASRHHDVLTDAFRSRAPRDLLLARRQIKNKHVNEWSARLGD